MLTAILIFIIIAVTVVAIALAVMLLGAGLALLPVIVDIVVATLLIRGIVRHNKDK